MFDRLAPHVALGLIVLLLGACAAPAPVSSPTSGATSPSTAASSPALATATPGVSATNQASTPPGIANADRPLTVEELKDVLIAVQATGDSATVVADVSLTPVHRRARRPPRVHSGPSPCRASTRCLPPLTRNCARSIRTRPRRSPARWHSSLGQTWHCLVANSLLSPGKLAWPLARASVPGARDGLCGCRPGGDWIGSTPPRFPARQWRRRPPIASTNRAAATSS